MSSELQSETLRIAIEISGNTIEEEIEMVKNISESLADAGFANVFAIVAEPMYSDTKAVEEYNKQHTAVSQDQPIVTVVSSKFH